MISTLDVLVTIGSGATVGFGLWHFFVPRRWNWYSYVHPRATELAIAIRAMNALFSLSLVLLGSICALLAWRAAADRYPLAVVLGAASILWAVRLALQIARPQASARPLLQHAMTTTFFAVTACFAGAFLLAAAGHSPYLGQKPPGMTPRIFAPGIVSTGNLHSRLAISPDGGEMCWSTVDMATFSTDLLCVREVGGRWTKPQRPPFAREGSTQSPMFSPDGRRLYFSVRTGNRWATAFAEKLAPGWGAPQSAKPPIDGTWSFTRSGKVYFSSALKTKVWNSGIFSAALSADGYSGAAPLDATINVPNAIDYTPYVSPDESFLLFSSNRPLVGDKEEMRIQVSFRSADGTWSAPRRVSEIPARFPSLSPDGQYLFFCGDDGNIYWVDARVIETLR